MKTGKKETLVCVLALFYFALLLLVEYPKYGVFWDEGGHLNGAYFIYYGIKDFAKTFSISETIANLRALSHQYASFSVFYYPPLFYVLNALTFFIVGVSPFAGKLVSMVFAVLTIYITYLLGRKLYGPVVGLLAAIFLAASALFFRYAMMAMFDIPTAFFFTLSILCFLLLFEKHASLWVFGAVLGIGLLHRYELILILPICISYMVLTKARKDDYARFLAGSLIAVIIASLWAVPTLLRTPADGARPLDWWVKNLGRHNPSIPTIDFMYLGRMLFPQMSLLPALFGVLGFFLLLAAAAPPSKKNANGPILLVCWIAVIYVFFSVIPNRLPRYTLSFLPAFAILGANFVQWISDRPVGFPKKMFLGLVVAAVLVVSYASYGGNVAVLDYETANYQYRLPIENAAKYIVENSSPGDLTFMASFRSEIGPGTLAFYIIKNDETGRKVGFTNIQSYELEAGKVNLTRFKALLKKDCPRFVVTIDASDGYSNEDSRILAEMNAPYVNYVKSSGRFSLGKKFAPADNADISLSVYERVGGCQFA